MKQVWVAAPKRTEENHMRIAVLGLGYTGRTLAAKLLASGHNVIGIGRRGPPLEEAQRELGPQLVVRTADTRDGEALTRALEGADRVVHLAPPPRDGGAEDDAARVAQSLPRNCDRLVYGSSTGVYAPPENPNDWVTEETAVAPLGKLGRNRVTYERALLDMAPAPVYLVRIAGIYGPNRNLVAKLRSNALSLFDDGPRTSRIYRDDLVRILEAMVTASDPPPKLIACDEMPAPTLEVARFAAALVGLEPPSVRSRSDLEARLSATARELVFFGKPCRSIYRQGLIGALDYPTYLEGLPAALKAKTI